MSLPPMLNGLQETDPGLFRLVNELHETAFAPGTLDRKTKTLIALALDAFNGAQQGVAVLAAAARKEGATDQEIAEALRMAYFVAGMECLIAGTAAFNGK